MRERKREERERVVQYPNLRSSVTSFCNSPIVSGIHFSLLKLTFNVIVVSSKHLMIIIDDIHVHVTHNSVNLAFTMTTFFFENAPPATSEPSIHDIKLHHRSVT